jgi:DNA-binding XRE family transcriptional regulator
MDKNTVKSALAQNGLTQTDIAKFLKVSSAAVHYVVSGKKDTPRIRLAIALHLGKSVSDLWPQEQKNTPTPAGRNPSSVGDGGRTPDPSRG